MSTALTFNSVTLSPVTHQNRLWIRAAELARALGYSRENSVSRLYRNNAEEFTPDMTQVIEISEGTDSALTAKTRLFSPRGCHLLAMFARTAVAKQFRRWVLDVLDKVTMPPQPPALPLALSTAASRAPLRSLVHAWAQVSHQPHAALWAQVKAHFQLSRIDDLPEYWLPDALAFVQARIDACQHTTALPSGALPAGNCSEIPNTSALPATRTPVDPRKRAIADKLEELIHELCLMRRDVRFSRGVDNRFADMHGLLFRMAESNLYTALDLLGAGARLQGL